VIPVILATSPRPCPMVTPAESNPLAKNRDVVMIFSCPAGVFPFSDKDGEVVVPQATVRPETRVQTAPASGSRKSTSVEQSVGGKQPSDDEPSSMALAGKPRQCMREKCECERGAEEVRIHHHSAHDRLVVREASSEEQLHGRPSSAC